MFNFFVITVYEIFLYVAEGLLLLFTTVLCHLTKHIPGRLSEARDNLKGVAYEIKKSLD